MSDNQTPELEGNSQSPQPVNSDPVLATIPTTALAKLREKLEQFPPVDAPKAGTVAPKTTAIYNRYNDLVAKTQEIMGAAQDAVEAAMAEVAETRKSYHVAVTVNEELSAGQTATDGQIAGFKQQLEAVNGKLSIANRRNSLYHTFVGVVGNLSFMTGDGTDPFEPVPSGTDELIALNKIAEIKLVLEDRKQILWIRHLADGKPISNYWHLIGEVVGQLTVNQILTIKSILESDKNRLPSRVTKPFEPEVTQSAVLKVIGRAALYGAGINYEPDTADSTLLDDKPTRRSLG